LEVSGTGLPRRRYPANHGLKILRGSAIDAIEHAGQTDAEMPMRFRWQRNGVPEDAVEIAGMRTWLGDAVGMQRPLIRAASYIGPAGLPATS
jgi:hypothetical protein